MLQINGSTSPSAQFFAPSGEELARLREEFDRRHYLLLPGLLDPALADEIGRRVERADFYRREHEGIGVEACMEVNATLAHLLILANDERVLEVVSSITEYGAVAHFDGRVYRLEPSTDHHDSWHSDLGDGRLVAMSVNLGTQAYEGGELEIRNRRTGVTGRAKSARAGDALLFDLGDDLEHRVLPVMGETPRTVFAGWFKRGQSFMSVLAPDGAGTAPSPG